MILKKACFASIFFVPLHCQKRNGVLLMEKRHVATRVTMFAVGNANRPIGDSP